MKLIFENWKRYLNEGIDPEIVVHITKAIEENLEIPIRQMFLMEDSTVLVHLQVDLTEHASDLMELVQQRWESSEELKQIKEMGYDVRLSTQGESLEGSEICLTKELL